MVRGSPLAMSPAYGYFTRGSRRVQYPTLRIEYDPTVQMEDGYCSAEDLSKKLLQFLNSCRHCAFPFQPISEDPEILLAPTSF